MLKRTALLTALLFLFLVSCRDTETITLLSDHIDALTLAEVFNHEHDHIKIIVDYRENLLRQLEDGVPFDLVAGSDINSRQAAAKFARLDNEFFLDTVYPVLLAEKGDHYVVPLSFDLPVAVFREEFSPRIDNTMVITPDEIFDLGTQYNKREGRHLVQEGFSPLWSDNYLYASGLSERLEWNIRETIEYRNSSMESYLNSINSWISEGNNGLDDEYRFIKKYRYIPSCQLLKRDRTAFEVFSLGDFLDIPQEEREGLDFRFISFSGKMNITERNFIAVSRRSEGKTSEYVLEWILNEENQRKILDYKEEKRIGRFGFFGGLSSLESVSHNSFSTYYPDLEKRIPDNRNLEAEDFYLPYGWNRVKKQVILPWINEKIKTGFSTSLEDYYEEWLFHTIAD